MGSHDQRTFHATWAKADDTRLGMQDAFCRMRGGVEIVLFEQDAVSSTRVVFYESGV